MKLLKFSTKPNTATYSIPENGLIGGMFTGAIILGCLAPSLDAATIGLTNGNAAERNALVSTLTALGHTVTSTINSSVDLVISAPGNDSQYLVGKPYLQISDWGSDLLTNTWQNLPTVATPITITLDGLHPILTGLDTSWSSLGFWHYGGSSYVGWVTGVAGLADANVLGTPYNEVLAISGNSIYIGWNVYGPDASVNDVRLLGNSIEFLTTGSVTAVPEPTAPLLGAAAAALLLRRRRERRWGQ